MTCQWADIASLNLLEQLMFQAEDHYLLLIGAYRDNEVDNTHLLVHSLENIKKNNGIISTIQLKPLIFKEVNQLVSDSIESHEGETEKLSELVYKKTAGNPFFVSQFMYKLYNDGRITFSSVRNKWIWEIDAIRKENITDNVVELMTSNILQLEKETQQVIKLASCIGNEFDLQTLVAVCGNNASNVGKLLWPALEVGLIIPLDDNYKIFGSDNLEDLLLTSDNARYRFLHDRIQQAAYSLILSEDRPVIHFHIGKTLLQNKEDSQLEDSLFDILNHINQGVHLIRDKKEILDFARLNDRAGKKAKASAAYSSAVKFYDKAVQLLGENSFKEHYRSSFSIQLELAEVSYLSGDIQKAERLHELLLQNGRDKLDKANVYILKSIMYLMLNQLSASKQACKDALALFDIKVPEQVTPEILQESFAEVETLRAGRPIADLFNLPELDDKDQYTIFIIYFNFTTPCFYTDQNLWIWITLKAIGLSMTYGNCDFSDGFYCAFGVLLGPGLGDYDSAYAYGELGVRLNEKYNNLSNKSKVRLIFGQMISPWKRHYKHNIPMAKEGYHIGNETGDLIYAGLNAYHYCWCVFLLGMPLQEVIEECSRYGDYCLKTKHNTTESIVVAKQMALALGGETENLHSLCNANFKENEYVEQLKVSTFLIPLHTYYIAKERLYYHSELYSKVLEMADLAKAVNFSSLGVNYSPEEYYFEALATIAFSREERS
jgi:predicted ATPase